jgi:hypothetical protein
LIIKYILRWVETKEESEKTNAYKETQTFDCNRCKIVLVILFKKELEIIEIVVVAPMLKRAQGSHASKLRGCAIKQ